MKRDWFAIVVIVFEIAIGLAATAGVYRAFHSY
jgi:NADH:ubiquinone oxidoreductase subunit K